MRLARTQEHQAKLNAGRQHADFDRIADPLWHAIAKGHKQEAAMLMLQLQVLTDKKKGKAVAA